MQLTQATDYALRAMVYLATTGYDAITKEVRPITAKEIAAEQKVPIRFMLKIMRQLIGAGLVKSYRGNSGGYALIRPAREINMLEIIVAMEGEIVLNRCLENPQLCNRKAADYCEVHKALSFVQKKLTAEMAEYSLEDLSTT